MPRNPVSYSLKSNFDMSQWSDNLKKRVKKAVRKVAIVNIESVAKSKLTSDGHIDTGALRADIHAEYEGGPRRILRASIGPLGAVVGTDKEYAGFVEDMDSYLEWAFNRAIPKLNAAIEREIAGFTEGGGSGG